MNSEIKFTYEQVTTIAMSLMKQRFDLSEKLKQNPNNKTEQEIEKINAILEKILEDEND